MKTSRALPTVLLLAALVWCAPIAPAKLAQFLIDPGAETTRIRFESKATLESFTGETRQAEGSLWLDPDALSDSITMVVTVDLATLDTGIGLRNDHMRNNHLHTDRYPEAVFRGARLLGEIPARLAPGETVRLEVAGRLDLHGIERPVRMRAQVRREEHEGRTRLWLQGRFDVKLSDFAIPRPKFLMLKVSDTQKIEVRALARLEE